MTETAQTPITPPVVVMGVSGSGKSTVGSALATRLAVPYADGDELHPEANIAKMSAGTPLDDADRGPWLGAVGDWLAAHPHGVMTCSALKRAYRDRLRTRAPDVWFLHLDGPPAVIAARQARRHGHFMPAALFASQLATLEPLQPDERGMVVDVERDVGEIVATVIRALTPT